MNDIDIIKAAECCFVKKDCKDCPLDRGDNDASCRDDLRRSIFDLIKRQNAEIERLEEENENLKIDNLKEIRTINENIINQLRLQKSEVRKEFAEKLKDAFPQSDRNNKSPSLYWDDYCYIIDELLEEMENENG